MAHRVVDMVFAKAAMSTTRNCLVFSVFSFVVVDMVDMVDMIVIPRTRGERNLHYESTIRKNASQPCIDRKHPLNVHHVHPMPTTLVFYTRIYQMNTIVNSGAEKSRSIPFVTASLTLHHLPAIIIPPDDLGITIGTAIAYRLTPTVYAHLHHACERAFSRPSHERPSPTAIAAALDALSRIHEALLATGIDPATIPQWTPDIPPMPKITLQLDFADLVPSATLDQSPITHDSITHDTDAHDIHDATEHEPNDTETTTLTPIRDTRPTYAKDLDAKQSKPNRTTTRIKTRSTHPTPSTEPTLFDDPSES